MTDITQVSGRGTVTLPASVRRRLGIAGGDVLTVEIEGSSVVLTPAVLTPIERYTDERLQEFAGSAQMTEAELQAARKAWGLRAK